VESPSSASVCQNKKERKNQTNVAPNIELQHNIASVLSVTPVVFLTQIRF
jgi:hypothetical protein